MKLSNVIDKDGKPIRITCKQTILKVLDALGIVDGSPGYDYVNDKPRTVDFSTIDNLTVGGAGLAILKRKELI